MMPLTPPSDGDPACKVTTASLAELPLLRVEGAPCRGRLETEAVGLATGFAFGDVGR